MLQPNRNILEVTGTKWYNVSGTSWKFLEEAVTSCQAHLGSYWKKMLQHIRNTLKLLEEDVTTLQEHLENDGRRCYKVSGTSLK